METCAFFTLINVPPHQWIPQAFYLEGFIAGCEEVNKQRSWDPNSEAGGG